MNLALLSKWWWRFKTEPDKLWRKVIWSFHHTSRSWNFIPRRMSISGPWKHICKISDNLLEAGFNLQGSFHVTPSLQSNLLFWFDPWLLDIPLRFQFPNLFQVEAAKLCLLKDRINNNNDGRLFQFHWTRQLTHSEHSEVLEMIDLISSITWAGEEDLWKNDVCNLGKFSVKLLRSKIRESNEVHLVNSLTWSKWLPLKVNFLLWRVWLNRLPTKDNLSKRNVILSSNLCNVCGSRNETLDHIFVECELALQIWEFVFFWCKIRFPSSISAKDLPLMANQLRGNKDWKQGVHMIIATTIWCIWRNRNGAVFKSESRPLTSIKDEITSLSYLWFKSRSKHKAMSLENWRILKFR